MSTHEASPADGVDRVSELFRCLASPVRVSIVLDLDGQERRVNELVEHLHLPQPLVSQHLRILRAADLVTRVRRGREVVYALTDDHVTHIVRDAMAHTVEDH